MHDSEKILITRQSPFLRITVTEDREGLRTMRFGEDGVRQSVVKPGDPQHLELDYIQVLLAGLAFAPRAGHILLVGLGGGTLATFLRDRFPGAVIDIVEVDPDVVEIAKGWCCFREDALMRAHVEDGRDFIERHEHRYDVILLDGFGEESIPRHMLTLEFLQGVRHALAPGGVAVANVWSRASNRLYDHMIHTYRAAFDDLYLLDVPGPGSKVFIALQRRWELTRDEVVQRARAFSREHAFRHDLGDFIEGFRNSDAEPVRGGEVMRD